MSSKRFQAVKRYFHVTDNSQLKQGNKVAKIKPIYDALNRNLTQFGVFHEHLSIDESMVPYFGRHSCKMFIRDRAQLGGGPQGSLPVTVQFHGDGHIRGPCEQGRCRVCLKNTRIMCIKCKARLHSDRGRLLHRISHSIDAEELMTID